MSNLISRIIEYLKEHWQRTAIITGVVLVVLSAAIALLLATMRSRSVAMEPINNNQQPATDLSAVRTYTDLYAVSIDNHVDARPSSGMAKAALVYEVPVEGGITRFLAVFERATSVDEIGPVRSARPYFLDWVAEFGPSLYLHFGGSPDALSRIATTPFLREADRDGMGAAGNGYWRNEELDAPHNAFTSSDKVEKMFLSRDGAPRTVDAWLMAPEPALEGRGQGENFTVPLSSSVDYTPEWRYERERNVYVRYLRDKQQFDRGNEALEAKNVIVLETPVKVLDDIGRLRVDTTGSGKAMVYRNGEKIEATWRNDVGGTPARFYGPDGAEIVLTEGNVWIEVVKK